MAELSVCVRSATERKIPGRDLVCEGSGDACAGQVAADAAAVRDAQGHVRAEGVLDVEEEVLILGSLTTFVGIAVDQGLRGAGAGADGGSAGRRSEDEADAVAGVEEGRIDGIARDSRRPST